MKSKIIKSILFSTIGVLSTSVVTPVVLSSCGKQKQQTIPVKKVELDKNELFLKPSESRKLIATILPKNATNKNVSWSSSNESIAEVDENGNVTAKDVGNVDITVTAEDGGYTDFCKVIVEGDIPVKGVTLDKNYLFLRPSEFYQLTATVLPENATDKNVIWKSNDESVATVDQNGNVTAKTAGNATITVTTWDGNKESSCKVTVGSIPVQDVTLDKNKLEMVEGEVAQLTATVLPDNATNKNVTWSSSDESVATVDQIGNVTAKTPGIAIITVTTDDHRKTDICEVTVTEKIIHATSVKLDNSKLFLNPDESYKLTATVSPEDAINKNVTWKSSTPSIAIVDQNGNVTAKTLGTATIKVTTDDGGYTDFCDVIVTDNVSVKGVTLDKDKLELFDGEVAKLTATILPENATNKKVTWKSSDESVATVDQNGNVTITNPKGISALTTITVTTEDGGYIARCTVIAKSGVTPGPAEVVGYNYDTWGNITVKYKLLSNHECRLLTKFNGEDSENSYVDGAGVLRIPDHVVYNGQNYYVERIPSEWSDGENNVNGIEFDNVSHLKEICDYAFKGTDALDNYHYKVLTFPEGLEYIGTEAFYNVDRGNDLVMSGIVFPSTLNAINVRAFANAGLLGENKSVGIDILATLTFKGNFNPENMREEAFSPIVHKHFVGNIYAPTIEIATNIANYIKVVYEDDFYRYYSHLLFPKVIGS